MVSTTVTGVAWVPVVTTDSARGLPSAGFAKALIMFSGFIMPILAQVDTCSPRGKPGDKSAESSALCIFLFLPFTIFHVDEISFVCVAASVGAP